MRACVHACVRVCVCVCVCVNLLVKDLSGSIAPRIFKILDMTCIVENMDHILSPYIPVMIPLLWDCKSLQSFVFHNSVPRLFDIVLKVNS